MDALAPLFELVRAHPGVHPQRSSGAGDLSRSNLRPVVEFLNRDPVMLSSRHEPTVEYILLLSIERPKIESIERKMSSRDVGSFIFVVMRRARFLLNQIVVFFEGLLEQVFSCFSCSFVAARPSHDVLRRILILGHAFAERPRTVGVLVVFKSMLYDPVFRIKLHQALRHLVTAGLLSSLSTFCLCRNEIMDRRFPSDICLYSYTV